MFKTILSFCFLLLISTAGIPDLAKAGPTVVEVQTLGHRCILVDLDHLPDDAPVIFMLHVSRKN